MTLSHRHCVVLLYRYSALWTLASLLNACGGGSTDPTTTATPNATSIPTGAVINQQNRIDFACDMNTSAAKRPDTPAYTTKFDPPNYPQGSSYSEQTWLINGIGNERPEQHYLKTIVELPPATAPKNGVVMILHGTSPDFLTPSKYSLADIRDYEDRWVQRGYAVVYIARRGYFGSTGVPAASDKAYQPDDLTSQRIDVGTYNTSYGRWQSASMTAAMNYMTTLPQFAGRMHSIVLVGTSLGANTALYTAAESSVFQAAARRAVIRFTGLNSQNYKTNIDSLIGDRAATASIAAAIKGPTLWYAGGIDEVAYLGQLACEFGFLTAKSKQSDQFYTVPGMKHAQQLDIASSTFAPSLNAYMRMQGFAGF